MMATHASDIGFDAKLYADRQRKLIEDRVARAGGRLYVEIGGKFLHDGHASRVLPGFDAGCKPKILLGLDSQVAMLFCVSAPDLIAGRRWEVPSKADSSVLESLSYKDALFRMLADFDEREFPRPTIVFNLVALPLHPLVVEVRDALVKESYHITMRYHIDGYPNIVAEDLFAAFERDEVCEVDDSARVILVTALGSNCGKLSTCLGSIYFDRAHRAFSLCSYAKFELFPVWNLELAHPINLAYEAATADIGDQNMVDPYYAAEYPERPPAVNYNRDIDAFPTLERLVKLIAERSAQARFDTTKLNEASELSGADDANGTDLMRTYRSPTDMGCNAAKDGIIDDLLCAKAALDEISRRKGSYQTLSDEKKGHAFTQSDDSDDFAGGALQRCVELEEKAKTWIKAREQERGE